MRSEYKNHREPSNCSSCLHAPMFSSRFLPDKLVQSRRAIQLILQWLLLKQKSFCLLYKPAFIIVFLTNWFHINFVGPRVCIKNGGRGKSVDVNDCASALRRSDHVVWGAPRSRLCAAAAVRRRPHPRQIRILYLPLSRYGLVIRRPLLRSPVAWYIVIIGLNSVQLNIYCNVYLRYNLQQSSYIGKRFVLSTLVFWSTLGDHVLSYNSHGNYRYVIFYCAFINLLLALIIVYVGWPHAWFVNLTWYTLQFS